MDSKVATETERKGARCRWPKQLKHPRSRSRASHGAASHRDKRTLFVDIKMAFDSPILGEDETTEIGSASNGTGSDSGSAAARPSGVKRSLATEIEDLKSQQKAARDERNKLAKELKNAQRRKRRLCGKARLMSNEDLAMVLKMRAEAGVDKAVAAASPQPPVPIAEPVAALADGERPSDSGDASSKK